MLNVPVLFPALISKVVTAVPPAGRVWFTCPNDSVGPPLTIGETNPLSSTVPEKPFTPERVKLSWNWLPLMAETLLHEHANAISKSGKTVNVRLVALDRVPFEPVTVTV